ncbi:glutathione S-transferase family protein [Sedimentitalea todarodis]|uniref:Glutathione S-transferase family protein n=1 Tax=Sedimentitalea todarodis TaxID=1631240 RepID=A0ABU3VDJ2_9RHOB|nr:glutathione S-transferase family protein [Sedimentitalea todarodis]MDU9004236.1 glutathione S-transferase family protein [Sedimentitalea todarodis]
MPETVISLGYSQDNIHPKEHHMLLLYTYPRGFGQFSLSPFCVKAAAFLQLSGLNWSRRDFDDPRKMPQAKLPVLHTDERLIPDSNNIRRYLENEGAIFDPDLSDMQRAQSHALTRMAEEHLYFNLVLDRWGNDAVWPTIRDRYFANVPALLRRPVANGLRRKLMQGLATHGIARFSDKDRLARVEQDLQAIQSCLWQSPFLMGNRPTSADLSVGPMLAAIRSTPVQTPLSRRVAADAQLSDYIARLEDTVQLP